MNWMDAANDRRAFLRGGVRAAAALAAAGSLLPLPRVMAADNAGPDLFAQINRAKDPAKLVGLELGHVPQIKAPDSVAAGAPFEVTIQVGEKLHEMIPAHYIDWIDLYADDIFLVKFTLTPLFTQLVCKAALTLNKSATLRAIEHCNLHGLWEGSRPVKIVPS